jgi:hypothetical protein
MYRTFLGIVVYFQSHQNFQDMFRVIDIVEVDHVYIINHK